MDQWLSLGGSLVAAEEEAGGNLREWLLEAVSEMAGPVQMDTTFESTGLDSLNLISLARRLSAKVGRAVSVADLYDHPTPQLLLDSFSGTPQTQLQRPKALCLHGFRSNRDAMSAATAPYLSAVSGVVEWIFLNAPRQASGPADPKIPVGEAFEWWGQRGGPFETGWLGPTFDGLEETLPTVKRMAPVGVVGFSQGGAVASLLECAWVALFSAVTPPGLQRRSTPSFHCYDPSEEYAEQMDEVAKHFSNKEVYLHKAGHTIPKDEELVRKFVAFITSAMAKPRTVG
jgi:aryl carrier-like protein